jgi:hypothetical protein
MESAMPSGLKRASCWLGFCAVLLAQMPSSIPPQTGAIEGDVTDSLTHKPLAGARVKLQAGERVLFTRCDENGRFQSPEVPVGNYLVTPDQPGYMAFGQTVRAAYSIISGTPTQVHFPLKPYAAISGRIVDSAGVPMEGATVELLRLRSIDPEPGAASAEGRRAMVGNREMVVAASARTNDLGEYRFARRSAGTYYVGAHPAAHRDDGDETERTTYYPRVLRGELARPVAVADGREVSGIDIHLIRQAGVRISGRAVPPAESPKGRSHMVITFVVAWRQDAPQENEAMLPSLAPNGAFELKNFLPGQYVIEAVTTDQTDFGHPRILLGGRRTVEVRDKDIDGAEIAMLPPVDIQGAVVFGENCPAVPVSIQPAPFSRIDSIHREITSAATGTFTLAGLIPGKYTLIVIPEPRTVAGNRYSVASARLGGREVLQSGFEIAGQAPGALRIAIACSAQPGARGVVR